jgi:hypothetical protein
MAEKKKRRSGKAPIRLFRGLKWVLIAVLVAGIAFLFTAKPVFNIDIVKQLKRDRTESGSDVILTRARDLFLFQTVEYVYKTVFPFDFVPAVYNWNGLLDREALGNELTAEEQEYLTIYRFCEDLGIKLRANKFDFVVITSVIRGGFNVEGTAYEKPGEAVSADEYVRVDEETKTLFLRLPPPVITYFEIEDPDRATYPYPDFEISPENWKRLTRFTSAKIEQQVLDDGILEHAKQKGKAFIEKLLIDSGLRHVVFLEPL